MAPIGSELVLAFPSEREETGLTCGTMANTAQSLVGLK